MKVVLADVEARTGIIRSLGGRYRFDHHLLYGGHVSVRHSTTDPIEDTNLSGVGCFAGPSQQHGRLAPILPFSQR